MKLKISYLFLLARCIAVFIFLGKSNSDKKRLKVIHVYLSTPQMEVQERHELVTALFTATEMARRWVRHAYG